MSLVVILNHVVHTITVINGESQDSYRNQHIRNISVVTEQNEGVFAVGNLFIGQGIVQVPHHQEVAVIVLFLIKYKVALVMVEHEIDEIIVHAILDITIGICPQVAGHQDSHHTNHLG